MLTAVGLPERVAKSAEEYVAAACGLEPLAVHAYLQGSGDLEAVQTDNLRAHRLGINGVPCFVVGGRHAIAGAQEPEVIERLLDVAALDTLEY